MSNGVFPCHYALGNVPNPPQNYGDETNAIYDAFFSRANYEFLKQQVERMNLGSPDWRSFTPYMKHAFRSNPGTYCMNNNQTMHRRQVAQHVMLLNRRVLERVVPLMKINAQAWNGFLRDRQGLTLIDRPCADGCKRRWNPVEIDIQLY